MTAGTRHNGSGAAPALDPQVGRALAQAAAAHQQGKVAEAEAGYRKVLQRDPDQPEALHLMGVLAMQTGNPGVAAQFLSRAVKARPDDAEAHNNLGEVYRHMRRLDDALVHYRRALALDAGNAGAACNMGSALLGQGKVAEAIAAFERALKAKPDFAEATAKLGAAIMQLPAGDPARDTARAIALMREGVRGNPRFGEGFNNLGNALVETGEVSEAIQCYRDAVRANENDPVAHLNLGTVLLRVGEAEEGSRGLDRAIALSGGDLDIRLRAGDTLIAFDQPHAGIICYRRAIEQAPERTDLYVRLGHALQKAGWHDEAATAFATVIEREAENDDARVAQAESLIALSRPDEALAVLEPVRARDPGRADARSNVAVALQQKGDFAGAQAELEAAIAADPDALWAYTQLAADRGHRFDDEAVARMEALCADESIAEQTRTDARFALGQIRDARGEHDRAFAHYREANRDVRKGIDLDLDAFNRRLGETCDLFTRAFMEARQAWGEPDERPVFVVGMPRSGTTLAEQILGSHPEAAGAGEMIDLPRIASWMNVELGTARRWPGAAADLDATAARYFARQYLDALGRAGGEARRIVDKLPANFTRIGLIAILFPKARIIHMERDPVDTCLSCYFQPFTPDIKFAFDLEEIGEYYRLYRRYMAHWHETAPIEILDVRYEDLVADTEAASRRMVEFIGLDWDPACLDHHRRGGAVATASLWQVRQPVYRTSVERWRPYEKHLGPLFEALGL